MFGVKYLLDVIAIVVLTVACVHCCNDVFKSHIGSTTPDMLVKRGDSMTIECTISTDTVLIDNKPVALSSESLIFKFQNARIPKSNIVKIDNQTIQYKVKRTSFKDAGSYFCYSDTGREKPKLKLICITKVQIGDPPADIPKDSLQCIGYHFKSMVCTWQLPKYHIKTNSTLHALVSGNVSLVACPKRLSDTSCEFNTSQKPPYRVSEWTLQFGLESNNSLGRHFQRFEIDHYSHVIPGSPTNLRYTDIQANNVSLEWEHPNQINYDPVLAKIARYQITILIDKEIILKKIVETPAIKVNSLIPFTNYSVQIRCFMKDAIGDHLKSEPLISFFKTLEDVPYLSPKIDVGSYRIIEKTDNTREVNFYFKPIISMYYNALEFCYVISVKPPLTLQSQHTIIEPEKFNFRLVGLDKNINYNIAIRSRNRRGIAAAESSFKVPSTNTSLPSVHDVFVIDKGQGHYTVNWIPSKSDMSVIYSIFACKIQAPDPKCISPLELVSQSTASEDSLKLSTTSAYNFAVAPINSENNLTSGLVWSSCIEKVTSDQIKYRFKKFEIIPLSSHSLYISWELDCRALYSFVDHFEINYCKVDNEVCLQREQTSQVNGTINELLVDNLESNSIYGFKIYAFTRQGQKLEITRKTGQTEINKPFFIIMGVILIFFIVFLLIFLYNLLKCAMRKRKKQNNVDKKVKDTWTVKIPAMSRNSNIPLNPLCQANNPFSNQYENKEYMNAHVTEDTIIDYPNGCENRNSRVRNDTDPSSGNNLFNSTDSGYGTKTGSDIYCREDVHVLNGVIDSASEDNPYACVDDNISFSDLSFNGVTIDHYDGPPDKKYVSSGSDQLYLAG